MSTVADKIKAYIAENHISIQSLSQETGIEISALSKALNNKRKIDINEYVLIIKVLGEPADRFLVTKRGISTNYDKLVGEDVAV